MGPEDAASYLALQEQISKLLDTLTPREKRVLILRFGLEMVEPVLLRRLEKNSM